MAFYWSKGNSYEKSYNHIRNYFLCNAKACAFFMYCDGYVIDVHKQDGVWLDNHGQPRTVEDILTDVEQHLTPHTQYYIEEIPSRWCKEEIREFMCELQEKLWLLDYHGFILTADEHTPVTVEHTPDSFYPWKVNGNAMEVHEMLQLVQSYLEQKVYWAVSEL